MPFLARLWDRLRSTFDLFLFLIRFMGSDIGLFCIVCEPAYSCPVVSWAIRPTHGSVRSTWVHLPPCVHHLTWALNPSHRQQSQYGNKPSHSQSVFVPSRHILFLPITGKISPAFCLSIGGGHNRSELPPGRPARTTLDYGR